MEQLISISLAILAGSFQQDDQLSRELAFEAEHAGDQPLGWSGLPAGTVFLDGDVVHEGDWSVRIERDKGSPESFTALSKSFPIDFGGKTLELRGHLRTEDVTGFAGLWLREDGRSGMLEFDNMKDANLRGTTEWTEHRIRLPLDSKARTAVFGALLAGEGKVWVDDLELLVDGKPVWEAPAAERALTVLETDTEFDQGSGIAISKLEPAQASNLALLGKVWGFLKYHHPRVAGGGVHWDYALFRVLPGILEASDRKTALERLTDWVKELGEIEPCDPCADPPENVHLEPDLDWLADRELLGEPLSAYLGDVYRNRYASGEQMYVSLHPVGNPDFSSELIYAELREPDAGFRILALFRFWNIIQYWFPYRDVIGEDWDGVLAEFLPRLVGAEDAKAYRRELLALIARVNDTHANLWDALEVRPPSGDCQLPVQLRFIEDRFVIAGLLAEKGETGDLQIGDVILELDGKSVESLVEEWAPFYSASNEPTRMRDIATWLSRGNCGGCTVVAERAGTRLEVKMERVASAGLGSRSTHDLPGETFQLLRDDVAYLKLSSVRANQAEEYVREAQGTKGLIIDIRNYPSEFVVFALGQHLVSARTPFARFTTGSISNPGAFAWTEPMNLTPAEPRYEGRIAILLDEVSVSQAEYTAMAFRAAPLALVIGSTTAGADGNVSPIPLPGGDQSMISGIGVFYPDKTPTQRVGIVPDIEVRPTVTGIREGRDEVLETALRQILGDAIPEEEIQRIGKR